MYENQDAFYLHNYFVTQRDTEPSHKTAINILQSNNKDIFICNYVIFI